MRVSRIPPSASRTALRTRKCVAVRCSGDAFESSDASQNLRRIPLNNKGASQKGQDVLSQFGNRVIMGTDTSEESWRKIDEKVNKYPGQRVFTAIGSGGDDFKNAMVDAVKSVVGTVHEECISDRLSGKGVYISVKIGPVWVRNADEVVKVYSIMKQDARLKWYM